MDNQIAQEVEQHKIRRQVLSRLAIEKNKKTVESLTPHWLHKYIEYTEDEAWVVYPEAVSIQIWVGGIWIWKQAQYYVKSWTVGIRNMVTFSAEDAIIEAEKAYKRENTKVKRHEN